QNIGQWIVDIVGLTKGNNIASLVHGVSLSSRGSGRLDTRLDTPPISFRHHPVSSIAQQPSALPLSYRGPLALDSRDLQLSQRRVGSSVNGATTSNVAAARPHGPSQM